MDMSKIKGTQLCRNCIYFTSNHQCVNPKAKKVWAPNQRNGCDYFNGTLIQTDWATVLPVGARPSTFSKND